MNLFRKHIIFKLLCLALAFHVFNMSMGMQNPDPGTEICNPASFVELVLEKVCRMENSVKGHENPDSPANRFELSKEFKVRVSACQEVVFIRPCIELTNNEVYQETYISQYVNEINHPPPKT